MIRVRPNSYICHCIQRKKLSLPPHDLLYMSALTVSCRTFPQMAGYAVLFFRDGHVYLKTVRPMDHVLMAVSTKIFIFDNVQNMIRPDSLCLFI